MSLTNLYSAHQKNMDLGRLLRRQQEMFREMGKLQRPPDEEINKGAKPDLDSEQGDDAKAAKVSPIGRK